MPVSLGAWWLRRTLCRGRSGALTLRMTTSSSTSWPAMSPGTGMGERQLDMQALTEAWRPPVPPEGEGASPWSLGCSSEPWPRSVSLLLRTFLQSKRKVSPSAAHAALATCPWAVEEPTWSRSSLWPGPSCFSAKLQAIHSQRGHQVRWWGWNNASACSEIHFLVLFALHTRQLWAIFVTSQRMLSPTDQRSQQSLAWARVGHRVGAGAGTSCQDRQCLLCTWEPRAGHT